MMRDKDYHALRLSDWLAMLFGPLAFYFYAIMRNNPPIP